MKKYTILSIICLLIGFFVGRRTIKHEEVTRYVQGETIRDTITRFIPDTVYLPGELKYKYVYEIDTVYKDVPIVNHDATMMATIKDWNQIREYNKLLFDNTSGKLSLDLMVQYNELQCLSYAFTPLHKEMAIVERRVFEPFVSISMLHLDSFSFGGGFFYHNVGVRVEYSFYGLSVGVLYKL